jgi:hypothetical protein
MLVLSWEQDDPFCHHRAGVPRAKLICRRPDPYSTRGEARLITALAHQYGWHSLLVVTSDDQATRARVRLRRCWDGGLRVLTVGASPWWRLPYTTVYEAAALVKAEVWQRGC